MSIPALGMSQTKEELLRHLNMSTDTYSLMAKETDRIYKWLTSGDQHVKKNCRRGPPYDWNDITEKSKHDGMTALAQSGDNYTSRYWNLADESNSEGCPNWIARWFLYHKFRYRDRRNRNKEGDKASSSSSNKHSNHKKHHSRSSKKSQPLAYSGPSEDAEDGVDDYDEDDYEDSATREEYKLVGATSACQSATTVSYSQPSTTQYSNVPYSYGTSQSPTGFYDPVKGWVSK